MRKPMIIAALVAVALGGVVACANKPATPDATPTAAQADQTKEVCTSAMSESTTAITTLKAKLIEAQAAFAAGDQTKLVQIQATVKTTATNWTAKLTELSGKPIKPGVKTVLTDGVTTINNLTASIATTSPADAEAKLTDFTTKLAAACAS